MSLNPPIRNLEKDFDLYRGKYFEKKIYFVHMIIKPWTYYIVEPGFKLEMKRYKKYYSKFAESVYGYRYVFYIYLSAFISDYKSFGCRIMVNIAQKIGVWEIIRKKMNMN